MLMSTKPRLASLYMQHLPHEETSPRSKIICTLLHVKKQALTQRSYAQVYKTQLASLYVQHLPHVKKQALAQRSYAHVYKTQASLSLHATSSTCEETSPCPKIICTLPHVKKQALAQRSYAHVYKTQTSLSLHATSST